MTISSAQRERETHQLIQAIGDISVKSLVSNDNAVCNDGIEKLTEIALEFLELKQNNEERYKVEAAPFFEEVSKNQYVSYIANEFDRIYQIAIKSQNSEITKNIIYNLARISNRSLSDENNWYILQRLFETRGYFGSLYWKLMEYALHSGSSLDKSILLQHLVSIPELATSEGKYYLDYVSAFITYHIFRVTKLIIDSNDFATFKDEIDQWSNTLHFKDPYAFAREIGSDLFPFYFGLMGKDLDEKCDRLRFLIEHECIRDFDKITYFYKELEEYRQLVLQKVQTEEQKDVINQKFTQINADTNEFFISSKVHGVFFRIASYLIFKGENYSAYIRELWYHTQPIDDDTTYTNKSPICDNAMWNVLYAIYKGVGQRIDDDLDRFDSYQSPSSYLYQYAVLLMIKLGETISFPNKEQMNGWKKKNENYQLDYYYHLITLFPTQKFLDALDKITKSKQFLSIIRLKPEETTGSRIKKIKEMLKQLEESKKEIIGHTISLKPIQLQKVENYKNQIIKEYEESSISNKFSNVSYNENLLDPDIMVIAMDYSMDREFFVEQNFMANFVLFSPEHRLSLPEERKIFSFITSSNIEVIEQNTTEFLKQISEGIQSLKRKGYHPDVIFIPLNVETEILMKDWRAGSQHGLIIDGNEYQVVHSWKKFPFSEIIILDSNYLSITYKAKNKEDKVKFEISNTEEGEPIVKVLAKLDFSIKITASDAFLKIINYEIKKLGDK